MFRRFAAVSVLSSAAMLGYLGARRMGEWIDAPLRALPSSPESPESAGITRRSVLPAPPIRESSEVETSA